MIGIYCITSPSGKIYIGSSNNIKRRWNSYKGLRCKGQKHLYSSFKKHGVENHTFEVVLDCTTEELLDKEQMYLNFFKPELNINPIAGRPPSRKGKRNSEETKKKMSAAKKGKLASEESKLKMSVAQKGRTVTEETRAKISATLKGKPLSEEHKQNISNGKRRTK
jgi:group I intron endonuclease